mmetsp:Transcript_19748/g.47697  ORF Transcript_19748/g.47697 Transcript_19748/m.47697 type:complete len:505 (+) Transcript_19748:471-1985(+)
MTMMDVSKFLVVVAAATIVATPMHMVVSSLKMPQIGNNRLNNNFGGTGGAGGVNRNGDSNNSNQNSSFQNSVSNAFGGYNNNNRSPAARPVAAANGRGPVASRSSPFSSNNNNSINNRAPPRRRQAPGGYQQQRQQPVGGRMPPGRSAGPSSSSALSFQAGGRRGQAPPPVRMPSPAATQRPTYQQQQDNLYRDPPQPLSPQQRDTQSQLNMIARGDVLEKIREIIESEGYPLEDPSFDRMVKDTFPGAISNKELETRVVSVLNDRGFTAENTLLATSLCCDELARVLEDDFVRVYGNNFNLGGLAGFPFAGNTGFGAMAGHIPDNGNCLIIHGPHVGITQDGLVGKVEREGIALVDKCCGSAIAASGYLEGITNGGAQISTKIQNFSDFQQGAVQELILPHGRRLMEAPNRMIELPYALYESQDMLMQDIIETGAGSLKRSTAVLGGVQINTSPFTLDYFHPLRFDLLDSSGRVVENLLPYITDGSGSAYNRIAFAPDGFSGL